MFIPQLCLCEVHSRRTAAQTHKGANHSDVLSKRCQAQGCNKRPVFGDGASPHPLPAKTFLAYKFSLAARTLITAWPAIVHAHYRTWCLRNAFLLLHAQELS